MTFDQATAALGLMWLAAALVAGIVLTLGGWAVRGNMRKGQ